MIHVLGTWKRSRWRTTTISLTDTRLATPSSHRWL